MRHLRTRVFFQLLVPVITIYLLVIIGGVEYIGKSFRANAIEQKRSSLANIVRGIDDWLLSRASEVIQLSRIPLFSGEDEQAIIRYMKKWQDTFSFNYDYLYLINPARSTYRATDLRRGIIFETDFINRFINEGALFLYAGPHRFGSLFKDHFVFGVPVYNSRNEIQNLLAATITRQTVQKMFGFYAFEDFDSWMMVNNQSVIMTHKNPDLSGKSETEVYNQVFLSDISWETKYVFVQTMRSGWKVVAFIEADRLMAPLRQAALLIAGFSVFLFLFLIVSVIILSAAVAKPVRQLTRGVYRIMSGDYSQRVEISTKDELSDLADSFNRLASRMIKLRTDDRFIFLGHIAARMAHELRKPLHVIQLASQSLEEKNRMRYLEIINQEVQNADHFIDEILNFVQEDTLDKQLYSLQAIIQLTVEKYRLLAEPHGISIICNFYRNIPSVYIDVIRMEEVIANILQNAVDALTEADPPLKEKEITLELRCLEKKEIQLVVSDNGPGFDEATIDHLFDPYFTTRENGTGLGLALCYRVLMAHGAAIVLANDEKHHGVVTITFPI
ncbi:MAG: sensor histidine kinase [Spirochaetales bacterium]|nr:sensor histidine kinase [Spirochaetales bacterium]